MINDKESKCFINQDVSCSAKSSMNLVLSSSLGLSSDFSVVFWFGAAPTA